MEWLIAVPVAILNLLLFSSVLLMAFLLLLSILGLPILIGFIIFIPSFRSQLREKPKATLFHLLKLPLLYLVHLPFLVGFLILFAKIAEPFGYDALDVLPLTIFAAALTNSFIIASFYTRDIPRSLKIKRGIIVLLMTPILDFAILWYTIAFFFSLFGDRVAQSL